MKNQETLKEFYQRKFDWIPESLSSGIGHFNVFRLPHKHGTPVPYRRRDFYKITLCIGPSRIHYADEIYKIEKQALVFSNPFIPYKWELTGEVTGGLYVIFNPEFFNQFGNLSNYSIFQPKGKHVYELNQEELQEVIQVFEKMETELSSDYVHKYDVLRNHIHELIHFALKLQPTSTMAELPINASQRIYWLFLELLERQFPIDENYTKIKLRTPSGFAEHLNVHVNHLNKVVKSMSQQTTSGHIAERLLRESKVMLKQNSWNISQISFALGFTEVTHFNYFFKKHQGCSPSKYRND